MSTSVPDPHLSRALAHAPDHDAKPPGHVSAQILAAAHREAATPRPASRKAAAGWRKPWGASGALATVLLAGVVGLLWRGEPPGPAVDGPAAPTETVQVAAPAAAIPDAVPADRVRDPASAPAVAGAAEPAAPVAPRAAAAQARAALADKHARESDDQTRRAAAAQAAVEAGRAAEQAALAAARTPELAADRAAAGAALPAAPARVAEPAVSVAAPPAAPAAASPPPPRPVALARAAMASPQPPNPGLPVLQAGDQLAWQPSSTAPVPSEEQLRQLAALTQSHWRARADLPPAGQAAPVALQWQRSGLPLGVLHLEPGVVWWCATGQNCLRAEVPPDALRALVGKLPGKR